MELGPDSWKNSSSPKLFAVVFTLQRVLGHWGVGSSSRSRFGGFPSSVSSVSIRDLTAPCGAGGTDGNQSHPWPHNCDHTVTDKLSCIFICLLSATVHTLKLVFIIFCLSRNLPPAPALQMLQICVSNETHGTFQSSTSACFQPENGTFSLLVK